ncbi:MAG: twin-arginine translocase subunit TatC [Planctomycetes bacterium]|nr:twin-arginine translocase subunit TatC [Planctomycetota bacterium]
MAKSRDLFDESTMSFGEHLEVLRYHMFYAIIGVALGVGVSLLFGKDLVGIVQKPIDDALKTYWDNQGEKESKQTKKNEEELSSLESNQILLEFNADDLRSKLFPDVEIPENQNDSDETITLIVSSVMFQQFERLVDSQNEPISIKVEEAFMTYLKVSLIGGLILSSPWVFYQVWLFVAAGLYPNERRYVYYYMPISLGLFFTGLFFCFFVIFPFILDFLLGFNAWLGIKPQIRISEWISFAVTLPLMFGISFQLPLVMLFLERISIFDVPTYREKRRISILVIAVISMLMTPTDPWSMLGMMIPLMLLYELGILMCVYSPRHVPFEEEEREA